MLEPPACQVSCVIYAGEPSITPNGHALLTTTRLTAGAKHKNGLSCTRKCPDWHTFSAVTTLFSTVHRRTWAPDSSEGLGRRERL